MGTACNSRTLRTGVSAFGPRANFLRLAMGTELSDEQLVELNEEFDKFAKDKEGPTAGQVACPDLPDLMEAIGMPLLDEAQYDEWVAQMDTDGVGFISFDNFSKYISSQMKLSSNVGDIIKAFEEFDKDKKGVVETAEFKRILKIMVPEMSDEDGQDSLSLNSLVEELDPTKSGKIDYKKVVQELAK